MLMTPIASSQRHRFILVRLMRRWGAERAIGGAPLPSLVRLGGELGVEAPTAVAIASLFELTEHCLGRALRAECCCSPRLGGDERAVLLMVEAAAERPPRSLRTIPHGLPGALHWAIESVRRLLGIAERPGLVSIDQCPFGQRKGAPPSMDGGAPDFT